MYVDSEGVDTSQRIKASYRDLWRKHQGDLGLYYRSLYSVFRYVSESDYAEKKKLANVARSLLSDFELVILFIIVLLLRVVSDSRRMLASLLF